jgi:DNA-binding Lrp family transcriptional regulator
MDDLDHELLHLLTRNARAPVTELSQKLKVSRGTVQNRIAKLLVQRIIRRFTVEFGDSEDDHQISAFTLIKLVADDGRSTVASLGKIPAITDIHTLSGAFDIVVEIRTSSLKRLDKILDEIRMIPDVAETQSHLRLAGMT